MTTRIRLPVESGIFTHRGYQLLLGISVLSPLGNALVSPILQELTTELQVSPSAIGLVISAYTAPAIVIIPIGGMLSDRFGRKPILVGGVLLFGISGSAIAFTTDFLTILWLRVLQGVGFAGIVPIIITSIGDIFDESTEMSAQGYRVTTVGISSILFPPIAGALSIIAWYYPFYIYALAIPAAVLVWLCFEEPHSAETESPNRGLASKSQMLFQVIVRRDCAPLFIGRMVPTMIWIGFLTYNSLLVVGVLERTPETAGLVLAVGSFAFALAASQASQICEQFTRRSIPAVGAHLCLGGGFAMASISTQILVFTAGILVSGFGFGILSTLYRTELSSLVGDQLRGSVISVAESLARIGGTIIPVLMGVGFSHFELYFVTKAAIRYVCFIVGIAGSVIGSGLILAYYIQTD